MGRGWNVAVGLVSDTTWVTPQAWRIVSRGSSTPGAPIGSRFSALIFFGSFLYQDKQEHVNRSLPCISVAMQRFNIALCSIIACIAILEGLAMVLQILRPYRAGNGVRCSWNYCQAELAEASLCAFILLFTFCSLECSSVAMQQFSVALWKKHCVHRLKFWLPQYPGLKPWSNVIYPFRAE